MDEVIAEYIKSKGKDPQRDDEFKIGLWHLLNLQPTYSQKRTCRPKAVCHPDFH